MRAVGFLLVAGATLAQAPEVQAPTSRPAGTVAELMSKVIYPTSNAVFYIARGLPKTQAKWEELQGQTLMLAESANLLMMPDRAADQYRWMKDAKLLLDVGTLAFKAAMTKNGKALNALSDQLLTSCDTCHADYRPDSEPPLPPPRLPPKNPGRGQPVRP